MKKLLLVIIFVVSSIAALAQTPTLVHSASCPASQAAGSGAGAQDSTPDYICPLPEPTQAGNLIVVGWQYDDSGTPTWTVSDDQTNTYTNFVTSSPSGNNNIFRVSYALNVAAGTRVINLHSTQQSGFVAVTVAEFANVATSSAVDGTPTCNAGTGTSIQSGSHTAANSGDLVVQFAFSDDNLAQASWTVGSQANITWAFAASDRHSATAMQYGVRSASGAFVPTMTGGTSRQWGSCGGSFKAAAAGGVDSRSLQVLRIMHQQMPPSAANPYTYQVPADGADAIVISMHGGGSIITGITSSPSNTWGATGSAVTAGLNATQMWYVMAPSVANNMTISVTRDNNTSDMTFMTYIIKGANLAFDADSGGQSGNQLTQVATLTTCSSCLTPATSNGLVFGVFGQAFCTATASTAPSGSIFDPASYTGNAVNGPQEVDQNNGWFHYYNPNTSAISATWSESCDSPESEWSGRVASFRIGAASTVRRRVIVVTQ